MQRLKTRIPVMCQRDILLKTAATIQSKCDVSVLEAPHLVTLTTIHHAEIESHGKPEKRGIESRVLVNGWEGHGISEGNDTALSLAAAVVDGARRSGYLPDDTRDPFLEKLKAIQATMIAEEIEAQQ